MAEGSETTHACLHFQDLLHAYFRRVERDGIARRLFRFTGTPRSATGSQDTAFYQGLSSATTLPEASRLAARDARLPPSPAAVRLGIGTPCNLKACCAIVLFLRPAGRQAVAVRDFLRALTEEVQKAIVMGRERLLKVLRYELIQRCPALDFLGTPAAADTPGHGAERAAGVAAYSHFSREMLFFAFAEAELDDRGNAPRVGEAMIVDDSMFDCVFMPLLADLNPMQRPAASGTARTGGWELDVLDSLEAPSEGDSNEVPADSDVDDTDSREAGGWPESLPDLQRDRARLAADRDRLLREWKTLRATFDTNPAPTDADRDYHDRLWARLGMLSEELAMVETQLGRIDWLLGETRQSSLLLSGDSESHRLLQALLTVVESIENETSPCDVLGPCQRRAPFAQLLRLRFAMALYGYLGKRKHTADQRAELASKMHSLFAGSTDSMEDAIEFFKGIKDAKLWGDVRANRRDFDSMLTNRVCSTLAARRAAITGNAPGEETLSYARKLASQLAEACSARTLPALPSFCGKTAVFDGYLWSVRVADLAFDALPSADAASCICALRETLLAASLESGAMELMHHCVEAVRHSTPAGNFAPGFEFSRPALRALEAPVQAVVQQLQARPAANVDDQVVTAILLLIELPRRILATDIIERIGRVMPLEQETIAFFSGKYAPSQSVGAQERWEYLAVRLCHGLSGRAGAAYRDILDRVTRHTAPERALSTAQLYGMVSALPGLRTLYPTMLAPHATALTGE